MHSSTIIAAVAFTMAVAAAPNSPPKSGGSPPPPTCSTSAANKCCDGFEQKTIFGLLSNIGLGCTDILGSTCSSGNAACCSSQDNGLVVVDICQIAL